MAIRDLLLPEFDREMANTRRTLERVPDEKLNWKPHEKSGAMGWLATHLANLPSWTVIALSQSEFDMAPAGEPVRVPGPAASRRELLEMFDRNAAAAREAIAASDDGRFFESWTLLSGGATMFTMPKYAVLRSFVLNHIVHHRAQLGVYLRLNDVPVPALYGPSADEQPGP